jgi:hypothetical protein
MNAAIDVPSMSLGLILVQTNLPHQGLWRLQARFSQFLWNFSTHDASISTEGFDPP